MMKHTLKIEIGVPVNHEFSSGILVEPQKTILQFTEDILQNHLFQYLNNPDPTNYGFLLENQKKYFTP
jgi:hypothetical protein